MPRLPHVVGLILCEGLEVDVQTGQFSLAGLFQARTFSIYPARDRFTVYAVLYGGAGEGTMKLGITRLETEDEIYSYERWWAAPGRGLNSQLEIKVKKCVFPAPGPYGLSLQFNDTELTYRYLNAFPRRGS